MNYFNIFLNYNASKFNLYAEGSGDIIVTNLNGKLTDFFQYPVFDLDYIKEKFNLLDPYIIRRITFDENISDEWHASELDNVSYNIDADFISSNNLKIWDSFNNQDNIKNLYDADYVGAFLAQLQLFGHPHQITGNNDKWISSENKLYPVYRNEGLIESIKTIDLTKTKIFEKYYYSHSLENYKKFFLDEEVVYYRNKNFKSIVDNSEIIIYSLDSIYNRYKKKHARYSNNFLKIKYNYKYFRKTLLNNIKSIENFLDSGFTLISYDGNKLKITSTRSNDLEIRVAGKKFKFTPTKYKLGNNVVLNVNHESTFQNILDISDLEIVDLVLNKTLEIEKDYSIITLN